MTKARERAKLDRDAGGFVAIPHAVLDSPGWRRATYVARALVIELAGFLLRTDGLPNGGLMATADRLGPRGWTSRSVLRRALLDAMECGLLVETRKGGRNRPSLFAVTWLALQVSGNRYTLDAGIEENWSRVYRRMYLTPQKAPPPPQTARTLKARIARSSKGPAMGHALDNRAAAKDTIAEPSDIPRETPNAPSDGRSTRRDEPSNGRVKRTSTKALDRSTVTL